MTDRAKILRPVIQAALDEGGVDAVVKVVCNIITEFETHIERLETRITELEARLNKDSSNSSKPPSSDGLKRPNRDKSLRPNNTGRKPGGQPGHPGQTLKASECPDITVNLPLDSCPECSGDLTGQPVQSEEKRQVFDLPDIRLLITEYLAQRKKCPHCGKLVSAGFPCGVSAPVQYGPGMQSAMTYLNVRQVIPCERVAEVCADLFGHRPSAGSVVRSVAQCAELLAPCVDGIRATLSQAAVLHADETGVRCTGKTRWLHVASTATHSLFSYSPKRGTEGFASAGVLPDYHGTLVHDFWGAYDKLECDHARCNAHLLRELKAFTETGQRWAAEITTVLLDMKKAVEDAKARGQEQMDTAQRKQLETRYDKRLKAGLRDHPEITHSTGRRGRIRQSKETNLLRRMRDKREEVMRFMSDFSVPFDNNQAERDLRMIKVQQKVSGCFRSEKGAESFCVISSFISTIRKQGINLMESIKSTFAGKTVPSST